ncbi:MAG: ABC transporter permease [Deltaproteobacteria bacterium]|nr:ABC transporter permease [Deltaproteobacteria bacterium]
MAPGERARPDAARRGSIQGFERAPPGPAARSTSHGPRLLRQDAPRVTKLWHFIRTSFSGLRQTPFVHGVAVLTLAVALFAGALARAAQAAVDGVLGNLGTEVEVTLYLAESATPAEVESVRVQTERESGGVAKLVSPDEALARLRQELGGDGEVLDGLPENPLPRTIELQPPPGPPQAQKLRELSARWSHLPQVTGVDYGREWIDRLASLRHALTLGAAVALALVLLAAVVVVAATLQLGMYARRDEIEIQKLVGATDAFVRTPYVLEGLLQGLLGAALAVAGLYLCRALLGPLVMQSLEGLGHFPPGVSLTTPRLLGEVVATGVALGVLGSAIAVGRFLRV